jgi:cyclase
VHLRAISLCIRLELGVRRLLLLAGDTLEDTVTFIAEPEHVVAHYENLRQLKLRSIDRILPNHGDPDVIAHGGYQKTLIDATLDYLRRVIERAHDPDYLQGTLEDYVGDSVSARRYSGNFILRSTAL